MPHCYDFRAASLSRLKRGHIFTSSRTGCANMAKQATFNPHSLSEQNSDICLALVLLPLLHSSPEEYGSSKILP